MTAYSKKSRNKSYSLEKKKVFFSSLCSHVKNKVHPYCVGIKRVSSRQMLLITSKCDHLCKNKFNEVIQRSDVPIFKEIAKNKTKGLYLRLELTC